METLNAALELQKKVMAKPLPQDKYHDLLPGHS